VSYRGGNYFEHRGVDEVSRSKSAYVASPGETMSITRSPGALSSVCGGRSQRWEWESIGWSDFRRILGSADFVEAITAAYLENGEGSAKGVALEPAGPALEILV